MKPRFSNQKKQALTLTEVLVMMVMLSLLAAVALADVSESQAKNQKIN